MFCDRIAACRVYQGVAYTDASAYDYFMRTKGRFGSTRRPPPCWDGGCCC